MKTVCFYFQVHQPWRLKTYRFFNMGNDHNYLDDFTNRSIMQKVARQCYLPMNALLLSLIEENKGAVKCIHRQIALTSNLLHNSTVGEIIEIVVVVAHIEETVCLQTPGLMYLKIETNGFHISTFYYLLHFSIACSYTVLILAAAFIHLRLLTSSIPFSENILARAG